MAKAGHRLSQGGTSYKGWLMLLRSFLEELEVSYSWVFRVNLGLLATGRFQLLLARSVPGHASFCFTRRPHQLPSLAKI